MSGEARVESPFRPGFGVAPPVIAGRREELDRFREAIGSSRPHPARVQLVEGARGMGKTTLLREYERIARSEGWQVVREGGAEGLLDRLRKGKFPRLLSEADPAALTRHVTGVQVSASGFGGQVQSSVSERHSHDWTLDEQVELLCGLLADRGVGLLLTVDEIHKSVAGELAVVAQAVQFALGDDAPIAFVAAGLPSSVSDLRDGPVSTFLRRATHVEVGRMSLTAAEHALREPIHAAGRTISPEALVLVARASDGYPYLVQLLGDAVWEAAPVEKEITEAHVRAVVDSVGEMLARQVHRPALSGLNDRAVDYLRALAECELPASTAEVAAAIGLTTREAQYTRRLLVDAGLIEPAGRGRIVFALPYLGAFLRMEGSSD